MIYTLFTTTLPIMIHWFAYYAGALYSSTTTKEIQIIKTSVEVEGVSTGYRIEIPVYFFRNNS